MDVKSLLVLGLLLAGSVPPAKKPNIVLILADDLGAEVLNCYGGTSYKTPHLDALARSGIRFENCFATPLCSPSRVQLMTGRYGFRTGWTQLIDGGADEFFDPKKEKTFGAMMKEAGYATGLAGKWQLAQFEKHPDHVRDCGFDEYCCWAWMLGKKRTGRYWDPAIWQDGKQRTDTDGKYGPDLLADWVVDFIRRHQGEPFFLYYPMVLVHDPFEPTPDSAGGKKGGGRKVFPDMVAYMDKIVGRIVATLDELKLRENTLVLFTGDNGTTKGIPSMVGERTVIGGKSTMLDTGSHVPLIASWPSTVPTGKVYADLVDFTDFVPTICELTGAKAPSGVPIDGRSFAGRLRGEKGNPREWVFVQLGGNRFARDRRWKLHSNGKLVDLAADPEEQKPFAAGTEPAEGAAARTRLEKVLAEHR
jgi:arylsulfatase A